MMITEDKFERVMRFLVGELSPAELNAFESEIRNDRHLKEYLEMHLQIADTFASVKDQHRQHENDFLVLLDEAKKGFLLRQNHEAVAVKTKDFVPLPSRFFYWPAAACIIALLSISMIVLYTTKSSVSSIVSYDHSARPPGVVASKNIDTVQQIVKATPLPQKDLHILAKNSYKKEKAPHPAPDILEDVLSKYDNGNYTAIQSFEPVIPKVRGLQDTALIKQTLYYFKGLSYIETNDNRQAVKNLEWVIRNANDPLLKIKSMWYLSLVYLKTNKEQKATELLGRISTNKNEKVYREKAKNLLQELK